VALVTKKATTNVQGWWQVMTAHWYNTRLMIFRSRVQLLFRPEWEIGKKL